MALSLDKAACAFGPGTGNDNDVAVSTTASAAIALLQAGGEYITVACDVAFNIKLGASTLADPSTVYPFPAGCYSFCLRGGETHMKLRGSAAGAAKWWRSS